MPIHILPDDVASQIAAGEVVERPASVVKELMENSLDAHATAITIRVEGAGKRLIEISDDGDGIPAGELSLAVARHATSKLQTADDLFHINTLGFRGEALASIGSVSRLSITSRTRLENAAERLVVEGGKAGSLTPIGAPTGTVIRVEDLFYNVPARLKFLKQDLTERQQIEALVTRYAIAYSDVRFQLYLDGRVSFMTSGKGDRREVLSGLYGIETARQMLEVNLEEEEGFSLKGFSSPVALTRSNRREITFFVNGRWVQDTSLNAALLQAYHTLLMVGRYPMAVLFVDLPAEMLDVNVHPAKAEVRFRHPDRLFSLVQRGVKRALLAYSPIPQVSAGGWRSEFSQQRIVAGWDDLSNSNAVPALGSTINRIGTEEQPAPPMAQHELPSGELPLLRLVGQVGATYLIAEGPDGLYLIDQHAAHERVLFEKFMRQRSSVIPSQSLLDPLTFQLPPQTSSLMMQNLPLLQKLGFQVEPFGPGAFLIRAIPALLSSGDPAAAVRVVVEDFEEDETPLQAEIEAKIVARVCKRVAVKAGKVLSVEEQRALIHDLETCQSPRTCPHGRPTMIHLSVDLLERQFGRRGAR